MPHSPFSQTVYPAVSDVDKLKRELIVHRSQCEGGGDRDDYLAEKLLDIGEDLAEQCEFLETKLEVKVRTHLVYGTLPKPVKRIANGACKCEYSQLARQIKKDIETLKEESKTQQMEIVALKSELEKMRAVTGTDDQPGSNVNGTGVEAKSQDGKLEIMEAENHEKGDASATSRKRGNKTDTAMHGKTPKKGRNAQ
ncbi:MAG: hypothetical protein Q9163_000380 [Psora crenata]